MKKPEAYWWSSLGYHLQRKNEDEFLSLDFGLKEFGVKSKMERLRYYRKFVYEKGRVGGAEKERDKNFKVTEMDRFRYRTRCFTDSGIIGSKVFVDRIYQQFKNHFSSKHEKRPKRVAGLSGVYSLKRLSEAT